MTTKAEGGDMNHITWNAVVDADDTATWECSECGVSWDAVEYLPEEYPAPHMHKETCKHFRAMNHTPAPWRVVREVGGPPDEYPGTTWIIHGPNDEEIASLSANGYKDAEIETKANALLFAAAPELLKSLQELINSPNWKENNMWGRARAAVLKATGANYE